jgi:hypothetical protein
MLTSTIRRARCPAGFAASWDEEFWATQETDIANTSTAMSPRVIRLLTVILLADFIARLRAYLEGRANTKADGIESK